MDYVNGAKLSKIYAQNWIQRPSGLYVAENRMRADDAYVTFGYLKNMDVLKFNETASVYGVKIEDTDSLICKMVKFSIFISKMLDDRSSMADNVQCLKIMLEALKAKMLQKPSVSPHALGMASFYDRLSLGPSIAIAEVLEFHGGEIEKGEDAGKHEATVYKFDSNANLIEVNEVKLPKGGKIKTLGVMSDYPTETYPPETDKDVGTAIENLGDIFLSERRSGGGPTLSKREVKGEWNIGETPSDGERRMVIYNPHWGRDVLLDIDVSVGVFEGFDGQVSDDNIGALRVRYP